MDKKHLLIAAAVLFVLWKFERQAKAQTVSKVKDGVTVDPYAFMPSANYGMGLPYSGGYE